MKSVSPLFRVTSRVVVAVIAVTALGACSSTTSPAGGRPSLGLSFSSKAPVVVAASQLAGSVAGQAAGTNTIALTKVQVVLSHVELSRKDSGRCNFAGDHECDEMDSPPVLVEVPMTGVSTLLTVPVDTGTYKKLDAELQKPDTSSAAGRAFVTANPNFATKNVRVEGTYNGTAFVFTALVESELEMRFSPPLVVTPASKNLSVAIDISRWFVDPATGATLNPTDPANAETISRNIRASFRAHEDEGKDG